jgi:hypothetical protein
MREQDVEKTEIIFPTEKITEKTEPEMTNIATETE